MHRFFAIDKDENGSVITKEMLLVITLLSGTFPSEDSSNGNVDPASFFFFFFFKLIRTRRDIIHIISYIMGW